MRVIFDYWGWSVKITNFFTRLMKDYMGNKEVMMRSLKTGEKRSQGPNKVRGF